MRNTNRNIISGDVLSKKIELDSNKVNNKFNIRNKKHLFFMFNEILSSNDNLLQIKDFTLIDQKLDILNFLFKDVIPC